MLRVVVIDDHAQFAEVVRATMGDEPDFESIGHAKNVADGIDLIETFEPDLVAVNVHIGPGDGIAAIAQITEHHPDVRVVVLAAIANMPMMQRAAAANARGFHPKDAGPDRLLWLLRNTGHAGFTVHPEVLHQLVTGGPLRPQQGGSASIPPVASGESLGARMFGVPQQAGGAADLRPSRIVTPRTLHRTLNRVGASMRPGGQMRCVPGTRQRRGGFLYRYAGPL